MGSPLSPIIAVMQDLFEILCIYERLLIS